MKKSNNTENNNLKLLRKEGQFFQTNVEGYWSTSGIVCSNYLICSDNTIIEEGKY